MKKTEIADATIPILIIFLIMVGVFFGFRAYEFGLLPYPHNAQSPSPNATLWEKAEWEKNHGGVCQCAPAFVLMGPILLFPSTNSTISKISFNVTLIPGMMPVDMKNTTFTLSTKNAEKTVRYDDPAVNLTSWFFDGTVINKQEFTENSPLYNGGLVFIELDLQKMGFTSPALGPDERFSLIITPPTGYRFDITRVTPAAFSLKNPIEIPGWH
jgi:archaellin